jgi:hypothetical protein
MLVHVLDTESSAFLDIDNQEIFGGFLRNYIKVLPVPIQYVLHIVRHAKQIIVPLSDDQVAIAIGRVIFFSEVFHLAFSG